MYFSLINPILNSNTALHCTDVQCGEVDVSPKLTLSNSSKASLNSALRRSSKLEPILRDKERIYICRFEIEIELQIDVYL